MSYDPEQWLPLANKVAGIYANRHEHLDREDVFAELSLWLVEKGPAWFDGGGKMEHGLRLYAEDYAGSARVRPFDSIPESVEIPDDTTNPEAINLEAARMDAVQDAVNGHSPEAAMIFRLVFQEGRTHEEAARRMGLPRQTYFDRWARIRADLADALKEWNV